MHHQQGKYNTLPWCQKMKVIMTLCLQTSRWSWKPGAVPRASVFVLTWINLSNHKLSQVFQTQIGGNFAALNLIASEIDTIANGIKEGLNDLTKTNQQRSAVLDIKIVSWSQTRLECWWGVHDTAVTCTTVNYTPTAPCYKPTGPPLKVYWKWGQFTGTDRRGNRKSSETCRWPGMDRVPSELISSGVDRWKNSKNTNRSISEDLGTEKWPTEWTKSLVMIPLPKKGSVRQCHDYRTISAGTSTIF